MMTKSTPLTTIVCITLAVLVPGIVACNSADNVSMEPIESGSDEQQGEDSCLAVAAEVAGQCMPSQQFIALWEQSGTMLRIDDSKAHIQLDSLGYLVQVSSLTEYIGTYQFDGESCTLGCGWCMPGESLCYGGLDDNMLPKCGLCLPWNILDPEAQCTEVLMSCSRADDSMPAQTDSNGEPNEDTRAVRRDEALRR